MSGPASHILGSGPGLTQDGIKPPRDGDDLHRVVRAAAKQSRWPASYRLQSKGLSVEQELRRSIASQLGNNGRV